MLFKKLVSGTSLEGMEIEAFKTPDKTEKYIYLLSGTHGDEVEGVFVLNKLFSWLREDEQELDLPIVVLPILNPDGYRAARRVNAHMVDLNRNMPGSDWSPEFKKEKYHPGPEPGSEIENQFLIKLLDKFPPALTLSFHSWKPFLNYNGDILPVAEFIQKYNQYSIDDSVGYKTTGSLGSYIPEKYDSGVITFELPTLDQGHTLNEIWEKNQEGLKELLKSDLIKSYLS